MSLPLILGLLIGLAVGGPLYYLYKTHSAKRRHAQRIQQRQQVMDAAKEEDLVHQDEGQENQSSE